MTRKIVIIGAGIIGAAIADALPEEDEITVIDAGTGGATPASFGWINASFYADAHHHRLRVAAMDRWAETGLLPEGPGALCWEQRGAALEAQLTELRALGYAARIVEQDWIQAQEPALAAPEAAILLPQERAIDASAVSRTLLARSGALCLHGMRVEGLLTKGGRVTGVRLADQDLAADEVILAAGRGAQTLLADVDKQLPLRDAPGLLVETRPVPQAVGHVLVGPMGEVRQRADGAILIPAAVGHQADMGEDNTPVRAAADAAMARLTQTLPGLALRLGAVHRAERPVPQDGLPVIGATMPGLYTAVMHSGVTLAAGVGQWVARELDGVRQNLLAPYRPDRFDVDGIRPA